LFNNNLVIIQLKYYFSQTNLVDYKLLYQGTSLVKPRNVLYLDYCFINSYPELYFKIISCCLHQFAAETTVRPVFINSVLVVP